MDAEKPWETALAGFMFTLCLVMLWVLLAMVPEWLRIQELMAVRAHTNFAEFSGLIYDMIKAERAA